MRARQPQPRLFDITSPQRQSDCSLTVGNPECFRLEPAWRWLILSIFALVGCTVWAQSPTPTTSQAQTPAPDQSQQKPDRVTTTVVVHGEVKDDYLSNAASAASLDNTPLSETPLSVTNLTVP